MISAALIVSMGLFYAWSMRKSHIKNLGLEKRTRRCIQAMDSFKRMMLDHIIPEIESYRKGEHPLEDAEEAEIRKILWDAFGIDWWGADCFWLEHHLFRLGDTCRLTAASKFSAKRLADNPHLLEDIPQLRKLLKSRLAIMNTVEWGKMDYSENDLQSVDFFIENTCMHIGATMIGIMPERVSSYHSSIERTNKSYVHPFSL